MKKGKTLHLTPASLTLDPSPIRWARGISPVEAERVLVPDALRPLAAKFPGPVLFQAHSHALGRWVWRFTTG